MNNLYDPGELLASTDHVSTAFLLNQSASFTSDRRAMFAAAGNQQDDCEQKRPPAPGSGAGGLDLTVVLCLAYSFGV